MEAQDEHTIEAEVIKIASAQSSPPRPRLDHEAQPKQEKTQNRTKHEHAGKIVMKVEGAMKAVAATSCSGGSDEYGRDVDEGVLQGHGGVRKKLMGLAIVAVRIGMERGLSDMCALGVRNMEFFWVSLGFNPEEEDDVVGGDLGCVRLMMEGRFEPGYAISGMVVTMRHGSWCIDGERRCGGCRFFAALMMWVTSLLRRDKVVADRVWLTVEELGFMLFGKGKTDMTGEIRTRIEEKMSSAIFKASTRNNLHSSLRALFHSTPPLQRKRRNFWDTWASPRQFSMSLSDFRGNNHNSRRFRRMQAKHRVMNSINDYAESLFQDNISKVNIINGLLPIHPAGKKALVILS
ncbi:hypothetical protein V8G54_019192 [Vigna mungo]|uniref:Uncharacterized protein n=1 Tax=Vigna mungo TaxID=3915 RepID=A0AAQ3NAG4_VIGMU